MNRPLLLLSFLTCSLLSPPQQALPAKPTAAISLDTLGGNSITPLKPENRKPAVVVFITVDCPIANALMPEINRLYDHYHGQGVQFTLVHVDPELSVADAKQHAADYSLKPPIVIDREHQLVKLTKVSMTPEVAIVSGSGKLVYTGRLNNQWTDYGKRRAKATEHNLRDTLDALLHHKPVPKARTTAIGCYIPDPD